MKVLVCTYPWSGHVRPLYAVARRLLERRCEVVWATVTDYFGDSHDTIAARIGDPRVRMLAPIPVTNDPRRRDESFGDMLARDGEYGRLLEAHLRYEVAAEAEHLRAILRRERPDVVASDGLMQAAVIACELERVRHVHVWTGLYPLAPARFRTDELRVLARYLPLKREVYARFGMAPRLIYGGAALSRDGNTVFTSPALVGRRLPPRTYLVGPYRPPSSLTRPFDWRWLDRSRPLVYVSFGSMLDPPPRALAAILAAASSLRAQVVVGLGDRGRAPAPDTDDVKFVQMGPQWALLERASAFISHGGANSVMEALARGTPMLVAPQSTDQPLQAHFLTRSRLGLALSAAALERKASVTRALSLLLSDRSLHRRLARVAAAARVHDGATLAANVIKGSGTFKVSSF